MPNSRSLLAILGLFLSLLITVPAAAQQGSTGVVERLHSTLLGVMQNAGGLGMDGRRQKLAPVLQQVYDYPEMARVASGSYWKSFSEEQKTALVDAFADMSLSTYAARFDSFGGERFETLGAKETPNGDLVQTRIVRPSGDPVRLDYLVRGGRIVDVYYQGGISELANQRSQFLALLKNQGYDALIAALRGKTAR